MGRGAKLFICYRADDDALAASRLYRSLKASFGDERLAMDRRALENGDAGRQPDLGALRGAKAVLVLIGERWVRPAFGGVNDPDDFVVREIAEARRLGLPLIPVLLDNADPPRPEEAPEIYSALFEGSLLRLREARFHDDIRLIEDVAARLLGRARRRRPLLGAPLFRRRRRVFAGVLLALFAAGFLGAAQWLQMSLGQSVLADQQARVAFFQAIGSAKSAEEARRQNSALRAKTRREAGQAAAASRAAQAALEPEILKELVRLGALRIDAQAHWSEAARIALIAFQAQQGLPTDGAPSQAALTALRGVKAFEDILATADQGARECASCPVMLAIPGGSFEMGSPSGEARRSENEGPRRDVRVAPFAIGRMEVSFDEWDACAADGFCRPVPSGGPRDNDTDRGWGRGALPVIEVSWHDVTGAEGGKPGFLAWLNSKVPGAPYRLPSEAEWEYAARAGTKTPFWWGDAISPTKANYNGSHSYRGGPKGVYRGRTVAVGSFAANPFGLFQMQGNVWEWTADCWHSDYRGAPREASPWLGARGGDCRSAPLRGGAWYDNPASLRAANRVRGRRAARDVNVGFRVARTLRAE